MVMSGSPEPLWKHPSRDYEYFEQKYVSAVNLDALPLACQGVYYALDSAVKDPRLQAALPREWLVLATIVSDSDLTRVSN